MLRSIVRGSCRSLEWLISTLFLAVILLILLFALYVELDVAAMVSEASSAQYQSYKPVADDTLSFEELRAMNPDVIGWITIDDTPIDYPIVQGDSNDTYINTSVFGEFSLTGAIFLDAANSPDFTDPLSILYGHNMTGDVMFGSLRHYTEESFFREHLTGTLYDGSAYYKLTVFACLEADGHDTEIYNPGVAHEKLGDWLHTAADRAKVKSAEYPAEGPILLLSTCATGRSNNRTLVAATVTPGGTPPAQTDAGMLHRFMQHAAAWKDRSVGWLGVLIWFLLLLELTVLYRVLRARHRRKIQNERERQNPSPAGGG